MTSSSCGPGVLFWILGRRILKNVSYFLSVLNFASLVMGFRLGREMKIGLSGWGADVGGWVLALGLVTKCPTLGVEGEAYGFLVVMPGIVLVLGGI